PRVAAHTKQPGWVVVDGVTGHSRTAVFTPVRDSATPATLVFTLDPQSGTRSLFSLRRQQRGQHARPPRISISARAGFCSAHAKLDLGGGICRARYACDLVRDTAQRPQGSK